VLFTSCEMDYINPIYTYIKYLHINTFICITFLYMYVYYVKIFIKTIIVCLIITDSRELVNEQIKY